jgi:predicted regulator of Ras-like GTPase activity (Roadblock/LC7/MglB family)
MSTKSENLKAELDRLVSSCGDIQGAFLAQKNGLLVSRNESFDPKKAHKKAAQAAVMYESALRFFDGVENGVLQKVLINGSDGDMVALPVSKDVFLAITAGQDPMLGMIFIEAQATTTKIKENNLLG